MQSDTEWYSPTNLFCFSNPPLPLYFGHRVLLPGLTVWGQLQSAAWGLHLYLRQPFSSFPKPSFLMIRLQIYDAASTASGKAESLQRLGWFCVLTAKQTWSILNTRTLLLFLSTPYLQIKFKQYLNKLTYFKIIKWQLCGHIPLN